MITNPIEKTNILDVEISSASFDEIIQIIKCTLSEGKKITLHNVNSYILLQSHKDQELKGELNKFSFLFIDGIGIYYAMKFLNRRNHIPKGLTGTDLYYRIIDYSIQNKKKVFFLGVIGLSPEYIYSKLQLKFPFLNIVGTLSDNGTGELETIEKINQSKADILFVGLGSPKQEKFIGKYSDQLQIPVQIAVGSGIEYLAGIKRRAPKYMQSMGLEWFYRLSTEPLRLWKRYLIGIPYFIWLIVVQKYRQANHTTER